MKIFTRCFFIVLVILSFAFGTKSALAVQNKAVQIPDKTAAAANAVANPAKLPAIITGQDVTIDQGVDRDMITAGQKVTVSSEVRGDMYAAGGNVEIKGTLDEDLIVAGGTVTISGQVRKNVIVAGGNVTVSKTAQIGGYVLGAGNSVKIDGNVNGPTKVWGESVNVSDTAVVGGDLNINARNITVSDSAKVGGIKNIVQSTPSAEEVRRERQGQDFIKGIATTFRIVGFFSSLVVLLCLVKILGNSTSLIGKSATDAFLTNIGWGLVKLVVTPFAAFLLFLTVIGIPLGFLTLVFYALAIYFATLISAIAVGQFIFVKGWLKSNNIYLQATLGLLIITILRLVPFVGFLVATITLLLGLGIIFQWEKGLMMRKAVK